MITLRPARLYDWPDIQALLSDLASTGMSSHVQRTSPCYVAEDVGTFVGFAMAERVDDAALVTAIGVLPGWRRTGLGSALADRLIDDLFDDGVEWAFATSSQEAVPFFKQLGFQDERQDLVPRNLQDRLHASQSAGVLMSRPHTA